MNMKSGEGKKTKIDSKKKLQKSEKWKNQNVRFGRGKKEVKKNLKFSFPRCCSSVEHAICIHASNLRFRVLGDRFLLTPLKMIT